MLGQAGNLKNAWVQGECDRDRGKKLHVSDSTSQGAGGPHLEAVPLAAALPKQSHYYTTQRSAVQPIPSPAAFWGYCGTRSAIMLQPREVTRTGDTSR